MPVLKQILRHLDAGEMKEVAEQMLQLEMPQEVRDCVKEKVTFITDLVG